MISSIFCIFLFLFPLIAQANSISILSKEFATNGSRSIPYPDFRDAIFYYGTDPHHARHEEIYAAFDPKCVHLFESIYYSLIEEVKKKPLSETVRIPKIVHQIWLGGKVPEEYRLWASTWAQLQGWTYQLWTDENIHTLKLYNQDLFNEIDNYGEKSDLLRLEILRQYGGVYVDMDFECFRPAFFEELHRDFDFYIGIEPLAHGVIYKYRMFKFCNAIIAAAPNHPLMEALIQNFRVNYLAHLDRGTFAKTGPSYITRIIYEYEALGAHKQRNIYLPCTFFYPFNILHKAPYLAFSEIPHSFFPETVAIHYWSQSWTRINQNAYLTEAGE